MKAARPSTTADRTLYWHHPDEEVDVIDLDRKARAANLAKYIRQHEQGKHLFDEGECDAR